MICKSCRQGADWITTMLAVGGVVRDATLEHAQTCHARCEGETRCDCQHKVGAQVAGKAVQR